MARCQVNGFTHGFVGVLGREAVLDEAVLAARLDLRLQAVQHLLLALHLQLQPLPHAQLALQRTAQLAILSLQGTQL